jgi:hypothetical protein
MWEVGGVVAIGTKFYDTSVPPVLVAATSVVATITLPDGTTNLPTVTNPSTGVYAANYTTTQAGHHAVSWSGVVGGLTVKYTDSFNVQEAAPGLILSLDEARSYLNFEAAQTTSDEELREFVEAATPIIEAEVGSVIRRTVTHTIYRSCPPIPLQETPVISLTSAAILRTGTAVAVTNMVEDQGLLYSKTVTPFPTEPWTLTYVVGRTVIPRPILEATGEVIKNLWSSQRGASGRRAGQETPLPFVLSYRAKDALKPYAQCGIA